jgi:hypothetical protein
MDKTWKAVERRVAEFFGTRRNPLSGENSGHSRSDTLHPDYYIEVKHRTKHTTYTLHDETTERAKQEGKTPISVLHEKGRAGFLMVLSADDFKKLTGA